MTATIARLLPRRLQGILAQPNPIWTREMRQQARVGRTPWILFSLTLTLSLLMCSIGGLAATNSTSPATLGGVLFQVFFSLAYLVVVLIGPTLAANGIASEREGRTWEAVLLAGLSARAIARGKFLAAYTTIALYIVVLAPVGALSFLFGGVTATEVVVAFAVLFLLAALAVAFGLAVSSLVTSLRGAIVVTLLLAICIGPLLYGTGGVLGSLAIHRQWREVPEGLPIWLPLAYSRAAFDAEYMLYLVAFPLVVITLPAWFLYEVTLSNLSGETDDRSTGLKRWFAVATPVVALMAATPALLEPSDDARLVLAIMGLGFVFLYLAFAALLFAHEPHGPSRRVRVHWDRRRAPFLTRYFGPGLARSFSLVVALGSASLAGVAALAILAMRMRVEPTTTPDELAKYVTMILVFATYAAFFFVFIAGLTAWLRAGGSSPWAVRLITAAVVALVCVAPGIVAAIGGLLARGESEAWAVLGGPSPFYAFYMLRAVKRGIDYAEVLAVGVACALSWGALGLVLLGLAARRSAVAIAHQDTAAERVDAELAAEDAARAASSAGSAA